MASAGRCSSSSSGSGDEADGGDEEAQGAAARGGGGPSSLPFPGGREPSVAWATSGPLARSPCQILAQSLDMHPLISAFLRRRRSVGGDETSPDEESTLKCGTTWSGSNSVQSEGDSSSSDVSSSSSDEDSNGGNGQDQSTGCGEGFRWLRTSSNTGTEMERLDRREADRREENGGFGYIQLETCHGSQGSLVTTVCKTVVNNVEFNGFKMDKNLNHHGEPTHKPPKRGSAIVSNHFDKAGSLDRRRRQVNRQARDQKCQSTILPQSQRVCSPSPTRLSPSPRQCFNGGDCSSRHHCHRGSCCDLSEPLCQPYCQRRCSGSQPDLYHGDCCSPCRACCCCHGSHWRLAYKPPVEVEDRLRRLECDKDSLQLQVAVLSEQIEAQTDKITDLEKMLDEKRRQLGSTENLLQREMLTRSSLETQKLELMSTISELKLQLASLERENIELRERLAEERRRNKPPPAPRVALHATSTPIGSPAGNVQLLLGMSPSPSPVSSMSDGSPRRLGNHPNSVEDFKEVTSPRTPPANFRRKVEHYGSLPRQRASSGGAVSVPLTDHAANFNPVVGKKGVAFAEAESIVIEDTNEDDEEEMVSGLSPQQSPSLQFNKTKGIKKIFGRMKRSGSGNLEDLPDDGEFRRGGVRATAGARLGWNIQQSTPIKLDLPFSQWDSEAISHWLQDMGLECYAGEARRWVKSGAQMLAASQQEIDKELGIKNVLHRKKLQLALQDKLNPVSSVDPLLSSAGNLDACWVLRWLDDAGLPQHKEAFLAARVDGRVLHRLTTEDLALLHVSSSLHVASLRRGIQVLRDNNFDQNCLQRRSLPDDSNQPSPQEVARWTNHRVMEWLRAVDLAEYAPNLRGSGVHGGLMVHEPRFTAELLASLLSIPPSKTLLRRHLNTHFKELLGRDCIQEKREAEATLGYVPLSATTKVKLAKKSQFTLKRKKSKSEFDFGDLVCPMDSAKTGEASLGDGMNVSTPTKVGAVSQGCETPTMSASSSERTSNV